MADTTPTSQHPELAQLGEAVLSLSRNLSENYSRAQRLIRLLEQVNTGLTLDQTLAFLYDSFRPTIPFDRLELLTVEEDGGGRILRSFWIRSDRQGVSVPPAEVQPLHQLGLGLMLESGAPQLIPNLAHWCAANPNSAIGRRAAEDGGASAMLWPLVAIGLPVGFLVFSIAEPEGYRHDHGELCIEVGPQLAMIIEKSRLYQRLVGLMEEKNRFLGIVAHDLRNPLGVIKGYADLLEMGLVGPLTERQSGCVDVIKERCRAMLSLINDLLDVSAIEAGRLELTLEEVELGQLLEDYHRQNQVLAQGKSIEFSLERWRGSLWARIDRNRMEQILNNLYSNALKFARPGTQVVLALALRDGKAEISVRDQGPGIPAQEQQRLFEEFRRGSSHPTGGEKSTGLGLAIAKRLVAAQRGQLFVKSVVGEGSTFGFRLPLSAPAEAALPVAATEVSPPQPASGTIRIDESGGVVLDTAGDP